MISHLTCMQVTIIMANHIEVHWRCFCHTHCQCSVFASRICRTRCISPYRFPHERASTSFRTIPPNKIENNIAGVFNCHTHTHTFTENYDYSMKTKLLLLDGEKNLFSFLCLLCLPWIKNVVSENGFIQQQWTRCVCASSHSEFNEIKC